MQRSLMFYPNLYGNCETEEEIFVIFGGRKDDKTFQWDATSYRLDAGVNQADKFVAFGCDGHGFESPHRRPTFPIGPF